MNFSDNEFKELNEQLKVKQPHLNHLKTSIKQQTKKPRKSKKPMLLTAFGVLCLLVVSFPFYSPALADIVAKVRPLAIEEGNGISSELTEEMITLLESNGYTVESVGVKTKGNIFEIGLLKGTEFDEATIQSLVMPVILEQGYDNYAIKIVEVENKGYKGNPIYEEVRELVKSVFAEYGYAKEADYELAGIQETWFSNIVLIDMPDHIKEADDIVKDIQAEIKERDLDVKKVEVHTFNLQHRLLDYSWGTVASTIYNAMAGQSTYQLKGLSYSVKKGHAKIQMETAWTEPPSTEIANEIEKEILKYFKSDEVVSYLPNPSYTIQFVNGEKVLLEISNK